MLYDMIAQQDQFSKIALDIAISHEFNRRMFIHNKYYEIEMLNEFAKYKNYSPISSEYFMFYHENPELVYWMSKESSQAWSSSSSSYYKKLFGIDEYDDIVSKLMFGRQIGMFILSLHDYGGVTDVNIWCYTFYTAGWTQDSDKVTLCFIVEGNSIDKRIKLITGGDVAEKYALYFGNTLICGNDIDRSAKNILHIHNEESNFNLYIDFTSNQLYQTASTYNRLMKKFFWVIGLLSFIISIYLAYLSYKPIKRIFNRYKQMYMPAETAKDELKALEGMLQIAYNNIAEADNRLRRQIDLLRFHLLLLILNGIYCNEISKNLWVIPDKLKGPYYCVICVEDDLLIQETQDILIQAEDLSSEDLSVYSCCFAEKSGCVLILSMADPDGHYYVVQALHELYSARNHSCRTGVGNVCNRIKDIYKSYDEAIKALSIESHIENTLVEKLELVQGNKKMEEIMEFVEEHALHYDFSLSIMADAFNMDPTLLSKLFKNTLGINFKDYLIKIRMNKAR